MEKRRLRKDLNDVYENLQRAHKEQNQSLVGCGQCQDKRQRAQPGTQKVSSERKGTLLYGVLA